MPIRRQTRLQAALEGLTASLAQSASQFGQYQLGRARMKEQQDFERQGQGAQALQGLVDRIAANPGSYQELIDGSKANPLLNGSLTGTAVNLDRLKPADTTLAKPVEAGIQAAKTPSDLPVDVGLALQNQGIKGMQPGFQTPELSPLGLRPDISDIPLPPMQKQAAGLVQAKQDQLAAETQKHIEEMGQTAASEAHGQATGHAAGAHEAFPTALADKLTEARQMGPVAAANEGLTAGSRFDALHTADRMKQNAAGAGMEAGAQAEATFPWQEKLAKTRADYQMLNQQSLDDYKRAHPHATSQELNRQSSATTAVGMVDQARQMLDEMDKRGMLGPLTGRGADLAASKIKAEQLFKNPADASLAGDFFSHMKLLSSLAAVVHGGARGGGSPEMAKFFEKVVNGIGDKSIITGQLNAVDRLMHTYAKNPTTPTLPIPGYEPGPAGGGSSILDTILARPVPGGPR